MDGEKATTELVPVSETRAELPPILAGRHTAAVEAQVRSFYLSVGDIFERWVTRRSSKHTQRLPPGRHGVPAPSLQKPTVRRVGRGPFANVSSKIRRSCSVSPKHCAKLWRPIRRERNVRRRPGVFCAMKRGPISGVNIAPNTASRSYRSGETGLFAQVGRTLNIALNTLP
jgi:hypothetical protein